MKCIMHNHNSIKPLCSSGSPEVPTNKFMGTTLPLQLETQFLTKRRLLAADRAFDFVATVKDELPKKRTKTGRREWLAIAGH